MEEFRTIKEQIIARMKIKLVDEVVVRQAGFRRGLKGFLC
jgi:hypothetical protein